MKLVSIVHGDKVIHFDRRLTVLFSESRTTIDTVVHTIVDIVNPIVYDEKFRCEVFNSDVQNDGDIYATFLFRDIEYGIHPKYQRRIIEYLQTRLPNAQLIFTTNSPFILQSITNGSIIDLDNIDHPIPNCNTMSIEDITEVVMGIEMPQRSKRYTDMYDIAVKYYKLLETPGTDSEEDKQNLKDKLNELCIPFSDDPAFMAFLKMERMDKLGR